MSAEIERVYVSDKFEKFLRHAENSQNDLTKFRLFKRDLFIVLCMYLATPEMAEGLEFQKRDPEFAPENIRGKLQYAALVRLNQETLLKAYRNYLKTYMKV